MFLVLTFWIGNMDIQPRHLSVSLHTDTEEEQHLEVIFLKDNKGRGVAYKEVDQPKILKTYYFKYPSNFIPDAVFIDLGEPRATWTVEDIGIQARFFAFGIDAYKWEQADLTNLIRHDSSYISLQYNHDFKVTTIARPARFYLFLDYSKLKTSLEFILVKIFFITCIAGLLVLLLSNYFWRLFATRTVDAITFAKRSENLCKDDRVWIVLGSLLLFITLIVISYANLAHPGLYIEDTMELSDSMAGGASLLDPEKYTYYRGYTVFLSELFVSISGLFPLAWQPSLYQWISILMICLAMTVMAYSGLFVSKPILLMAPLVLCLGSFSGSAMYLTLTGTLFSSTALLMALAVRPLPTQANWLLAYLVLIGILVMSGPYTPLLIPLAFGLLLFNCSSKKSLILIAIMLLAIVYTSTSSSGMLQLTNVLDADVRTDYFKALVHYVLVLEMFATTDYRIGFLVCAFVVGLLVVYRGDRIYVKHSIIFLLLSLVSLSVFFLSFKYHQYRGAIINSHTVIAQLCWVIFILLTADKIIAQIKSSFIKAVIGLIIVVLFCSMLIAKDSAQSPRTSRPPDYNSKLPGFFSAVNYVKKLKLQDNEFVQLWYKNIDGKIVSFKTGSDMPDAISINISHLPHKIRPYFLPISLERKMNMMIGFSQKKGRVGYSDGVFKDISEHVSLEMQPVVN